MNPATKIKKVTVLYNLIREVKKGDSAEKVADDDNLLSAKDVYKTLEKLGYEPTMFELNTRTLEVLDTLKTDLIFNLLEGFDSIPNTFSQITAYVESLNIPYTGSTSFSGFVTIDKARTKDFLVKNKIPTPNYQLFISPDEPLKYNLRFPLITKPNLQDASIGITQESVVKNSNELRERISIIKDKYKDTTLAEEYIEGRELEVFAVNKGDELIILPVLEGVFIPDENRKWDICDFEHKWGEHSYCNEECPAKLTQAIKERIEAITLETFRIFDIKGYGRLDIRLSKDEIPYVVEVNINPGFDEGVLSSKLKAASMTYGDLVQLVIDAAIYEFENRGNTQAFLKGSSLIKSQ